MQRIALRDSNVKDFVQACRMAVGKAGEMLDCPVIVAWKDDRNGRSAPENPGAKAGLWRDYGERNEGVLELAVANDYHFVFTEAEAFDASELNATRDDNATRSCV